MRIIDNNDPQNNDTIIQFVNRDPTEPRDWFTPWSIAQQRIFDAMYLATQNKSSAFVLAGMRAGKTMAAEAAARLVDNVVVVHATVKSAQASPIKGAVRTLHSSPQTALFNSDKSVEAFVVAHDQALFVFEDALWLDGFEVVVERVLKYTNRVIALSSRSDTSLNEARWPHAQRYATWDVNPNLPYKSLIDRYRDSPVNFARDFGLDDSRQPEARAWFESQEKPQ